MAWRKRGSNARRSIYGTFFAVAVTCTVFCSTGYGQTASTGALTGSILDPSGGVLPGVEVQLTSQKTGDVDTTTSDNAGIFLFPLLSPGTYELLASKAQFDTVRIANINIFVTETSRLHIRLRLAKVVGKAQVSSEGPMVETDTIALGRVVDQTAIAGLPLVTRNFAQITALSPGVATGVSNAGQLGPGGTGLPQIDKATDGLFVHGARSYDNNFELDGISVSDVQASASASGGSPIPNPDTIQEFKVQTALYSAAYGRYAGANISVVTRSGSNSYHGSLFEFFRNSVLNANDYFLNRTGQPRPPLNQNQAGFDAGGPIKREKLFFFGSYQGTRQINGLAAGQARTGCTVSLSTPPLTNDRSAAALGRLFGGMTGALGGVAVVPNGSNINPVALALLNFKLPNGSYLIPTPQTINVSQPLESQGFSTLSEPCHYDEDQFLVNADYVASVKSRLSLRSFWSDGAQLVSFPGNGLNTSGNLASFPSNVNTKFRVWSANILHAMNSRISQSPGRVNRCCRETLTFRLTLSVVDLSL